MAQEKQLSTIVEGKGEVPFSPKVNSSTVYDENGQQLNTILQSVKNKIKECSSSIGEQREKIGGLQTIVDEAAVIAKESTDAISQSQKYMQQLNEAIADLPDGQAVSAEVADHELRVSDLETNSATKEEVTSKYGDYSDISEFLSITTDADDKILEGTKKDGTKVFSGNVDAPNIRQLDTGVALANAQAQQASETAQQAVEQMSDIAEDVDEAKSQAQSAVEQTQQLSQDVAEKYGDYEDVSEFLEVVTDSEGKILEGVHKDGTKEFFGRVKSPNIEKTEQKVAQMEDNLGWFESMLNQEWAEVTIDDENRIIKGVKKDGTAYFYKLESPTLNDEIKEIVKEMVGNVGKDINLQPSTFLPSEVQHRTTGLSLPDLDDVTLTPVTIDTQAAWNNAMTETLAVADTHLLLILNTDVKMTQSLQIAEGNTLVINGNGHKILGWTEEYQATSVKGTYSSCAYEGTLYGSNVFIAPDGEVLRLARTKCYTAASRVLVSDTIKDKDNNTVLVEDDHFPKTNDAFSTYTYDGVTYKFDGNTVYHCKFQLPSELADLSIPTTNSVYVNLTSDWTSVQAKVIKAENGWLYFDYQNKEVKYDGINDLDNYIGIDNDFYINGSHTSFYLINYQIEDNKSCLLEPIIANNAITGHTLVFPNRYTTIAESTIPLFRFNNPDITIKIFNATLVGMCITRTMHDGSDATGNIFILDKCLVKGCVGVGIYIRQTEAEGYITNCEICDCDMDSIVGDYTTKLYVVNNYIHNVGNRRLNAHVIKALGIFYIAHNRIEDYGWCAVGAGVGKVTQPVKENDEWVTSGTLNDCHGIVEYNTIQQTKEYFQNEAQHRVPMDSGTMHCGVYFAEIIIRHNIIYGYTGRGFNRGLYMDNGCNNYYIYSNIVANTNHFSIKAYYNDTTPYYGLPYTINNVGKRILNNYVENGIELGGRTNYPNDTGQYYSDQTHETGWHGQAIEDNGCRLGHNIINTQTQNVESIINGIDSAYIEEQYKINMPSYQGAFSTSLDISGWLNKL